MAGQRHFLEIDGRKVAVSNPAKPMYPSGFTKGEAIDYYIRISDYLLPHIHSHPITMKRYPNGVRAAHFYQKDAPASKPEWVETFAAPRRTGGAPIRYVLLNDLSALVWSANLANLEIHPFLARAPHIERPCSLVFDLDPGEGMDALDCIEVGLLLKSALAARGLECFAKVSGSKGLQLYAPLNTQTTYAETQPLAHGLARELERAHPDRIVSGMAKEARPNKIFIDWSQNADFKTTVSVYSLRAKHDRPYVSLPFTWTELQRALKKKDRAMLFLEPAEALKRVQKPATSSSPFSKCASACRGTARRRARHEEVPPISNILDLTLTAARSLRRSLPIRLDSIN